MPPASQRESAPGSSRPAKAVFCIHDRPKAVGGPYSWVARLLPNLRRLGVDARALVNQDPGQPDGAVVTALRRDGVPCVSVPRHTFMEDSVRWVLDQAREDRPDVLVPNVMVGAYFAARWLKAAGIPCVGVLHSDDPFHRGLQDTFILGPEVWRLSAVVTVSRYLTETVRQRSSDDILVTPIPCGVEVPASLPPRPPGPLRLAYVGRLVETQKRVSDVCRALCRAAREIPGVEADLIGDGPARPAIEAILATEGAGLPVRCLGRVDPKDMQAHLARYHALVLLSDFEGLPIVVLEAMASGCVPVCLDIRSGIPELVIPDRTGVLVQDRGDDFIRAIRDLARDPDRRARLSLGAVALVRDRYEESHCHGLWAALIRDLAGRVGEGRPVPSPLRLGLPPVHPDLAREDLRQPPFLRRGVRKVRARLRPLKAAWHRWRTPDRPH